MARAIDEMAASLEEQTIQRDRAEQIALQANKELMQNDQRKDEFLAMLAHELRNPLAPIRNAAHILTMTDGTPRISSLGKIIGRQVDHMTELVDDLLDVSRVTRGLVSLDLRLVDVNIVVQSAVEQTRPLIDARGHALAVRLGAEPVLVQGDETRLVQIVANLLNNAAKYTPAGGRIAIEVRTTPADAQIAVTDNGVGMNADLLPRVFELFSQAQRTPDRSEGGLGLGLALVKGLVALHGGTIAAASDGDGCGSSFLLCLPRSQGQLALPRATAEAVEVPGRGNLRLLVVDDNADAADTTALFLTDLGFQVAVEYTGTAALARAPGFAPRVCLLDIGLPDMDGYALVAQLRLMPENAGALMVAVTGYGQEQDKARAREAGFDLHLVKPVDLTAFSRLLAQL